MKRTKLAYTEKDENGIRWRWVGMRRVSEIADKVMKDVGMKPWK